MNIFLWRLGCSWAYLSPYHSHNAMQYLHSNTSWPFLKIQTILLQWIQTYPTVKKSWKGHMVGNETSAQIHKQIQSWAQTHAQTDEGLQTHTHTHAHKLAHIHTHIHTQHITSKYKVTKDSRQSHSDRTLTHACRERTNIQLLWGIQRAHTHTHTHT